jgi:hypothetical protein
MIVDALVHLWKDAGLEMGSGPPAQLPEPCRGVRLSESDKDWVMGWAIVQRLNWT